MALIAYSLLDRLERGTSNEDPLGFFTYATRLADEWLPGITTRTRRARYYSMICGGLYLIEEGFKDLIRNSPNRDEETAKFFMRWERIWAAWNGAVDAAGTGMIGKNKISNLFDDDYFTVRNIDYPFIQRQSDLGALGSYRTSLEAMGFLLANSLELTFEGKILGELFWAQAGNNRAWNQSIRVLDTRKFTFPCYRYRLAEYATRFGLDLRRDALSDANAKRLKEEKMLIRSKLLPCDGEGARRYKVLEYVRHHGWGELDEYEILTRAGHRGRSLVRDTDLLERCAAAIIALEEFRRATLDLLNLFRDHLYKEGRGDSPKAILGEGPRKITARVNITHRNLLRFVRSAEFQQVFRDFPMADCRNGQDAIAWITDLLEVHKDEMAKRRSPRWFIPAGGGKWTLDSSIVGQADNDDVLAAYSYRTNNLLSMARETGCRI
ncbi:MAG: hypothetical protein KKG09_04600 [Verrucomicrobia bacterium]|nr:hypothetical protein [Verrucomicrobiota bacterium]MBU4289451.1 hypothetical protein [Verrucomicrobiota bacterium]MBU4428721.1 hypothetical protein [Verrucomicrobiota bacterium]MBU4497265.1 hypothetical protein [Verrucomicrobiota bacterium]MCG2679158.1 hypothetical protein [Kiritimatiellia bacterium]